MIKSVQRRTIKGKSMVVLTEAEYQRLLQQANLWEPELPKPDKNGNLPALAAMAVVQARDIIRARRRLGLSQIELAKAAGVRVETIHRIETAKNKPNTATMEKIDRALKKWERRLSKSGR